MFRRHCILLLSFAILEACSCFDSQAREGGEVKPDFADSTVQKLLEASNQRKDEAERAVKAMQEKRRILDERQAALDQKIDDEAQRPEYAKDGEVVSLGDRINKERERLLELNGLSKKAKLPPFRTIEEMLSRDRALDERSTAQAGFKVAERQIAQWRIKRYERLVELMRRDPAGQGLSEEWDKLKLEKALADKEYGREQAERKRVFDGEGHYVQEMKAEQAPLDSNIQEVQIDPPVDAAQRKERFLSRNSTEGIRALGEDFFAQMCLDGLGLEETRRLVEAKNYPAALDAYKRYFFSKLTPGPDLSNAPAPDESGSADSEARTDGEADALATSLVPPSAEKIQKTMEGFFFGKIVGGDKQNQSLAVKLGEPGAMNWVFARTDGDWQLPFCQQLGNPLELGSDLRRSYVFGGSREHLIRWSEILDDWAMNWQRDVENSPLPVRNYYLLTVFRLEALIDMLAQSARLRPSFVEDLPSTTLARVLMVANQEYLPSAIRLGRSGLYNLRIMALNSMVPVALKMQEFHAQQWALKEAWRQVDNNFVYKIRRDGANFEFANEGHEDTDQSMLGNLDKLKAWQEQPDWLEPYWGEEFTENFLQNTRYRLHNLKQDGYCYRLSTRSQFPRYGGDSPLFKVNLLSGEPEVARRMWSVFGLGELQDKPQILSESMAFQGYYYLRGGWNPDDYFLYFQSIGQPILSGREDSTGFMFYNYGRSMLMAPATTVDGKVQNIHYGSNEKSGGKSYYANYGLPDAVKPYRFLGGEYFDFCEGSFEGVYERARPSAFFYPFGVYDWFKPAKNAGAKKNSAGKGVDESPIKDVQQARQILAVKGHNLFIVTDTVYSELAHVYKQDYTVYTPVRNDSLKERLELLLAEKIKPLRLDEKDHKLVTQNVGLPNLEMAHFSSFPVRYSVSKETLADSLALAEKDSSLKAVTKGLTKRESQEAGVSGVVPWNQRVAAQWEGKGRQILVTLFATTPAAYEVQQPEALRDLKPMALSGEAAGFTARFADGTPVSYVAQGASAEICLDTLTATASVLLLVGDRGVALDCTKIAGMRPAHPDFTFHLLNGQVVEDEAIYRPIQPVIIEPAANVFVDRATVELSCATKGVEIHYTLDGSRPLPQSPLYTGPFQVDKTCRLKARAFRPEVKQDIWQEDGTLATVVYSAVLRKEPLATAMTAATKPGLTYEYFEGPWTTLMARNMDMPAQKKGIVANLLDVSQRQTKGAFGFRYLGYLDVPEAGVYTFYCPREYTFPDVDAGYELRLFVDNREWNPAVRWQGHGTWSIALQKGLHAFRLIYVDARSEPRKVEFVWGFPDPSYTWNGVAPTLSLSGPGLEKQSIPAGMLRH